MPAIVLARVTLPLALAAGVRRLADAAPSLDVPIDGIANARREQDGESDPERSVEIVRLLDLAPGNRATAQAHPVPLPGETPQGGAKRNHGRMVVAQRTDKGSNGRDAPGQLALSESASFRKG